MFSSEFCEISKNTFFTEHLWATASVLWNNASKEIKESLSTEEFQKRLNKQRALSCSGVVCKSSLDTICIEYYSPDGIE